MGKKKPPVGPQETEAETCSDWEAVTRAFDSFPSPGLKFDEDGELAEDLWVFRGHKSADYKLKPAIEREADALGVEWDALESVLYDAFLVKARTVVDARDLPGLEERLGWLALMQHYGAPTRLLDFTLSPYIALHFALRQPSPEERESSAALWAIDAKALVTNASLRSHAADEEEKKREAAECQLAVEGAPVNPFDPANFTTSADTIRDERAAQRRVLDKALNAGSVRRYAFNETGFVSLALPPMENRRLSSQQGTFLLSGATDLTFENSLSLTMKDHPSRWCRLMHFPASFRSDLERRLFQMNIHDLSLFPDIEGLVGFIRQKARLQMA